MDAYGNTQTRTYYKNQASALLKCLKPKGIKNIYFKAVRCFGRVCRIYINIAGCFM